MRVAWVVAVGLTVAVVLPAVSRGDGAADVRLAPPPVGGGPPADGGEPYRGVAPGQPNLPPHPPRLPIQGPARLTWTGFQIKDGRPTVFLELTNPVEWQVSDAAPDRLVYTLRGTRVPLRNNRRELRAGEFGTVVRDIDIRPHGKDTEVVISLRQKTPHHEKVEDAAGGYKLLLIQLGE